MGLPHTAQYFNEMAQDQIGDSHWVSAYNKAFRTSYGQNENAD